LALGSKESRRTSPPVDRDYRGEPKSFGASDMPAGFSNEEQQ